MSTEQAFRWIFILVLVGAFSISGYYRRRARQSGDVIPRAREGKLSLALRLLFAAPLYLSLLAYMVNPEWMAWSSVPIPAWLRWAAAAVGLGMLPLLVWVFRSIGRNISETVLTKADHALVTQGPYRWVRHPLYAAATAAFLSLGVVAANWFMMAMAVAALLGVRLIVVPREEAELTRKFGEAYREYRKRTGALLPRVKLFD